MYNITDLSAPAILYVQDQKIARKTIDERPIESTKTIDHLNGGLFLINEKINGAMFPI
jgi:hypothetical protein